VNRSGQALLLTYRTINTRPLVLREFNGYNALLIMWPKGYSGLNEDIMKKIIANKPETIVRKRSVRTILLAGALTVAASALFRLAPGAGIAQQFYEAYYNYLGNYPDGKETGWREDVQGISHDQDDWFITQTERLWKIPVAQDLNGVRSNDPGVLVKGLNNTDMPELKREGYDHLGDPSYYEFGDRGYVLVPITGGPQPALAAFSSDTLQYIDHAYFEGQTGAGWCAVDPGGNVYSSNNKDVSSIRRYAVDWDRLSSGILTSQGQSETLTLIGVRNLFDERGSSIRPLQHMQGGVISPSGQLLYVVAGFISGLCKGPGLDSPDPSWGIHVFDLSTGKRIQRSTNGYGHFNYEFNPTAPDCEEPEGITIWDLDDGRAPGIRGQLHVLLLDNDLDADDVYLKHYTHTIYVDRNYIGGEKGTPSKPLNTVTEANNMAWDGARIKIKAGSYPTSVSFSKRIELVADGGRVTVGR
jgi:hypothetical protein